MSELDEELQDLLSALDKSEEPESPEPEFSEPEIDATIEQINARAGKSVALRPIDELAEIKDQRRFDGTETITAVPSPEASSTNINIYLEKIDGVADEVLQACRSDRQEAQDVINMLRNQCDQAHQKNQLPARMYIDGLVKAVEVKANINTNAVKAMEAVAKMIAATKAGIMVNNNNLQVSGSELDEILSHQPTGDLD